MVPVSIVIITKNEVNIITDCLKKAVEVTNDIIVIDSGSTDDTTGIAAAFGCRVVRTTWDGYGANKNKGINLAKYNWILSIDADEMPDDDLINSLHRLKLDDPSIVYDIRFRSYFGEKAIRFGCWGRDHHIRLFNRGTVRWSETMVHETLLLSRNTRIEKIAGCLHHYSVKNADEYNRKCNYYAKLCAKKYFISGKKATAVKLYCSPIFGFLKNYILYLGFLDGREGWEIARVMLKNTRRKYQFLNQMQSLPAKKERIKDNLAVDYQ